MQPIATQIHNSLLKAKKTIAVAESCTGGLLSSLLTQNSGSAQYFILGFVTYSNKSKENILSIPAKLIASKGAVSKETAQNMALSVRKIAQADYGVSITGIAGPTGGTLNKPVGTVFIAISGKSKTICKQFNFSGNRASIRKQSATTALKLLKQFIYKEALNESIYSY